MGTYCNQSSGHSTNLGFNIKLQLILSLTGDVVGFAGTFGFDTAEPSDPIPTPVPPDFTKVA